MPTSQTAADVECHNCGESDTDTTYRVARRGTSAGNHLCEDCYGEEFTPCAGCSADLLDEDINEPSDSETSYCNSCYRERYTECDLCNRESSVDDITTIDGDSVCDSCLEDRFAECYNCGDYVHRDSAIRHDRRDYCENCQPGSDFWNAKKFTLGGRTFSRISQRSFGIELETSKRARDGDMRRISVFGCKHDGSIEGKEYVSPPLIGDEGLAEVEKFCAKAAELKFEVNTACGFHLHLGVKDCAVEELVRIAAAYCLTQTVWQSFVPSTRRVGNSYCHDLDWTVEDVVKYGDSLDQFEAWADTQSRYQWFNVAAYAKHDTLEIRLHSATLDAAKVVNWTRAHAHFMDWAKVQPVEELQSRLSGDHIANFRVLSGVWAAVGADDLTDFYADRARQFGRPIRFEASRLGQKQRAVALTSMQRKRLGHLTERNLRRLLDEYTSAASELGNPLASDPFRSGENWRYEHDRTITTFNQLLAEARQTAYALFDLQTPAQRERQFGEIAAQQQFCVERIVEERDAARAVVEAEKAKAREEERARREQREREYRLRRAAPFLPANWRQLCDNCESADGFILEGGLAYVNGYSFTLEDLEAIDVIRIHDEREQNQWKVDLYAEMPSDWRERVGHAVDPDADVSELRNRSREEGFLPCSCCNAAWVRGYQYDFSDLEAAETYAQASQAPATTEAAA